MYTCTASELSKDDNICCMLCGDEDDDDDDDDDDDGDDDFRGVYYEQLRQLQN